MRPLDPLGVPLAGMRLIEANAGTGKTYTITTLCLRLLLERRLAIDQILVVTYTNAATAELRRKVRERMHAALAFLRGGAEPEDDGDLRKLVERRRAGGHAEDDARRLEAALYGFDEAAIFTIHGFCQRVLQEHAFESSVPFDVELLGDDRVLLDEVVRDFWSRELYDAPLDFVEFLAAKRIAPERLVRLARLASTHPELRVLPDAAAPADTDGDGPEVLGARLVAFQRAVAAFAPAELRRRKHAARVQSFDDLLQRVEAALRGPGGPALAAALRARYPAALIDEFQDTDPVQYRIFDAVYAGGGTLFLIGDPKQAIYGFRGADVFSYTRAKRNCGDETYTLLVNRRSSPSLVQAVNTLFVGPDDPFILPDIPYHASSPAPEARDALGGALAGRAPLRFLFVPQPDGKPMNKPRGPEHPFHLAIAGEIAALVESKAHIGDREISAADVAVLCRTNDQTKDMQAALATLGVRSVLQGDASVFETVEAEHVERVVRAMADPSDPAAITAALLTPLVGLTGDQLFATRADERAWEYWIDRFQDWHDVWLRSGFTAAFRRLLDDCDAPARILGRLGGERCLTNVFHLGELLQGAAAERRHGPLALVEWLRRMCSDELARIQEAPESAQIRLESDAAALKLVTIHKSKGLQYPVVVCPFLWAGNKVPPNEPYPCYHDPDADDRLTVHLAPGDREKTLATRERLAESLRLLYVAVTRAEQLCLVAWGKFRECQTSALGYLLHQPNAVDPGLDLCTATAKRIQRLSDAEMRADLERLAARSGGTIEVVDLATGPPAPLTLREDARRLLQKPPAARAIVQRWRMASFSALAAAERALPEPAEEGLDRDELVGDSPAGDEAPGTTVEAFPRGRRLGTLVHRLFEEIDFTAATPDTLGQLATELLPAYGFEAHWAEALAAAVGRVLDTPLTVERPPLALRAVPPERRVNEVEFVFPVGLAADESSRGTFTAEQLAGVFARHGDGWLAAEYAPRLAQLPFGQLAGYLRGYIDLVFAAGDRWYIVDYKTNDLGTRPADYRTQRLVQEMQRHHYVLQAYLYTVAWHRHLQRRLADYAYERHFGGVFYLFVRGMAPGRGPACGVFFDRPRAALIEELSAVLAAPEAEEARR